MTSNSIVHKTISFQNQNGLKIVGTLSTNQANDLNKDVAIICHGLSGNRHEEMLIQIRDALLAQNICSVFAFDFNGNGDSDGEFSYGNYYEEVSDLRFAVEFLRKQYSFNVRTIIGHSKGAGIVLLYGAKYDDVDLVISVSARYLMKGQPTARFSEEQMKELQEKGSFLWKQITYPSGKKRELRVGLGQIEERANVDIDSVANMKESRVLLLHGTSDQTIPFSDVLLFQKVIKNAQSCDLAAVEGANHFYKDKRVELCDVITNWIKKQPHQQSKL